jgi:hypothetical protein
MDALTAHGAALDVMNVARFKFTPEEIIELDLSCKKLKQVVNTLVVKDRLIIEVDMGPLTGHLLVQAIEVLLCRVRQIVKNLRPAPHLELVHTS